MFEVIVSRKDGLSGILERVKKAARRLARFNPDLGDLVRKSED